MKVYYCNIFYQLKQNSKKYFFKHLLLKYHLSATIGKELIEHKYIEGKHIIKTWYHKYTAFLLQVMKGLLKRVMDEWNRKLDLDYTTDDCNTIFRQVGMMSVNTKNGKVFIEELTMSKIT